MNIDTEVNAIQNIYQEFLKIIEGVTIKYSYLANENETLDTKMAAEEYFGALHKVDTFYTYTDYTKEELDAVGCYECQFEYFSTYNNDVIPLMYRDALLNNRRQSIVNNFEEKNDYYRMLNGYPNVSDTIYYYLPESIAISFGIDPSIPVHEIQDYYNATTGNGDYLISIIEGAGYINEIYANIKREFDNNEITYEEFYTKSYLRYIGSKRIDLYTARRAKNFEILQLLDKNVRFTLYDEFTRLYEECREYFVTTIYVTELRSIISKYDQFIAMCIMVMTIQQLIMKQITLGTNRTFFDIYAVKALYEAYGIPYNLKLSEEIQKGLLQNLNLLIQNKATDKVLYDIGNLLGFSNLSIYKYYLSRQRKFDTYGLPIVQWTSKFDTDTGEYKTVLDYEAMYNLYFQKAELRDENFITSFNQQVNRADYEDVTSDDPYWIEDERVYDQIWETEYNFVESKYLGLGLAYRLTDLIFDNVALMKMIISQEESMDKLRITLPKITGSTQVSVFDCIISLICLTACKHNLYGDIITIPTQVISVLDFMRNIESGDEFLVDTLSLDFSYFDMSNEESQKAIQDLKVMLGSYGDEFMRYVTEIMTCSQTISTDDRRNAINGLYKNTKALYIFISFMLSKTHDRKTFEALLTMYHAAFYSKEVKDVFTITGKTTGFKRTAWSYYEYLYYKNPILYGIMFKVDIPGLYKKYLEDHGITEDEFPFTEYMALYETGEIKIDFGELNYSTIDGDNVKDELIYEYASHIISRLESVIDYLNMNALMGDITTPTEDLLLKLVKFFKSYTAELISFEITLICDLKTHQIIKLFDEIHYMEKLIQIDERIKLRYGDIINHISSNISFESLLKLTDEKYHEVVITIDKLHEEVTNIIPLHDKVTSISTSGFDIDTAYKLFDSISVSTTITSKDILSKEPSTNKTGLRDVVKLEWEDD